MSNSAGISLLQVMRKLESIDQRLKTVEKKQVIPEIKLSRKETIEIENAKKEIQSGNYLSEKELFRILGK
ncbi:MAG: hypothetical protein HY917_04240 [Candidatus Diapherotrites archaeon]|nr:hypothetical protein [Candidatus Diapherotrites archaeon]